jgi:hypothetical protein
VLRYQYADFFPSSVRDVHLKFEKKIRRLGWVSGVQMFTSRAKYVGLILTAVFLCTLRPQQLAVFPAYFQFTHSRTTSNPFSESKIPGAGGLYGDASRPDCGPRSITTSLIATTTRA